MKFGVALGRLNPAFFVEVTDAAERLGFESVWLPEHLVFPVEMTRSPYPGAEHPPVPPSTPVFDVFAYLAYLAARTRRVRLATHVYNLALRHPFVAARAVQTLDIVSGGRAEIGIGAGWLESEWHAAGLDFATRGRAARRGARRLQAALDRRRRRAPRRPLRLPRGHVRAQAGAEAVAARARRRRVASGAAPRRPCR